MQELKGRVAVVTGAASGIGRAMALRFAREGMKLVLADVEEEALRGARDEIASEGAETIAVRTDVSDGDQVEALAARTFEVFGATHVLCNNAGVGVGGRCWESSVSDWEWVLGVNVWGVIHGVRAFVPRMLQQTEGHVVNTASIFGLVSAAGMGPYCASKHAVVAISECLHHDLAAIQGCSVRVSVVCPAWVKTNIAEAERNRPGRLTSGATRSRHASMMQRMMQRAVHAGAAPSRIAEQVVSAVRQDRFWVLTHPHSMRAVEKRMTGVLENRCPEFDSSDIQDE